MRIVEQGYWAIPEKNKVEMNIFIFLYIIVKMNEFQYFFPPIYFFNNKRSTTLYCVFSDWNQF